MGLCSSSDEFCQRTDDALKDIPNLQKIVDDILLAAQNYEELYKLIEQVFKRCEEYGITLSKEKIKIGKTVKFAGFIVSEDGVSPDPEKVQAITEFPPPNNVSQLRSFLGLTNQLSQFHKQFTEVTAPMRELLRNNVEFQWLEEQQDSFVKTKKLFTSPSF